MRIRSVVWFTVRCRSSTKKAVPELAEAMEYLLTNDSQRARLANNGRETVEQHFNTETSMARIASEIPASR